MTLTKLISAAVLTSAFLLSTANCLHERDTHVTVEGGNPPKFIMKGSGHLGKLRVGGPKKQREGIAEEPYIYWEIEIEKSDSDRSIESLSAITYGLRDISRFTRILLRHRLRFWETSAIKSTFTMNANGARLDFAIHKGKVVANPTIRDGKTRIPYNEAAISSLYMRLAAT